MSVSNIFNAKDINMNGLILYNVFNICFGFVFNMATRIMLKMNIVPRISQLFVKNMVIVYVIRNNNLNNSFILN